MVRLVAGQGDKLCRNCKYTKMIQLPQTKTWLCSVCNSIDYYIPTGERTITSSATIIREGEE